MIVVPGILGSDLVDNYTGKQIWGFPPKRLIEVLATEDGLRPLQLTAAERDGDYRRVTPTGLLTRPTWFSHFGGFEDYQALLRATGQATAPELVHRFPYDWRLPVAYNGTRLAEAARRWLTARQARQPQEPGLPTRLVFVAHSTGGLVVQAALAHAPELAQDTEMVITLGTPFYGVVKAAAVFNGNRSGTDPAGLWDRVGPLAASLPGMHDLLPTYRCLDRGNSVERLTPGRVADLGGDEELAEQSLAFQERMLRDRPLAAVRHWPIAGSAQPTLQSMRLEDGVVYGQHFCFEEDDASGERTLRRVDRGGDGTVYRETAFLPGGEPSCWPVQHGMMPGNSDVLERVRQILAMRRAGPLMGEGELGLDIPDAVLARSTWDLRVTGIDTKTGVGCLIQDTETRRQIQTPQLTNGDECVEGRVTLPGPGLYRVQVKAGGPTPVAQFVAAIDPAGITGEA